MEGHLRTKGECRTPARRYRYCAQSCWSAGLVLCAQNTPEIVLFNSVFGWCYTAAKRRIFCTKIDQSAHFGYFSVANYPFYLFLTVCSNLSIPIFTIALLHFTHFPLKFQVQSQCHQTSLRNSQSTRLLSSPHREFIPFFRVTFTLDRGANEIGFES